jgi:hypothetical protein
MIKRLAHRNANVQLYTLEVGESRRQEVRQIANPAIARKRTIAELWYEDTQRAGLEKFHGCYVAFSCGQGA